MLRLSSLLLFAALGCSSSADETSPAERGPGMEAWELVPKAQVAAECDLDPDLLEEAIWNEYPHGLSASPDCNYVPPWDCSQTFDVGVWYAAGLMGNYIIGHPGLDMVLVVKNIGSNSQHRVWDAIRPALVALDPAYQGDEETFCEAYAAGDYAPSL